MNPRRSLLAHLLASGWAAAVVLAYIPLYIRFLGMEGWGLIGFFATFQAWALLLDLGLGPALNREMARHSAGAGTAAAARGVFAAVERLSLAGALAVAALGGLLAWPLAQHGLQSRSLPPGQVAAAVTLMGLATALQWMAVLYRQAVLGLQRQVWISVFGALSVTLRGLASLAVLAWWSATIEAWLAVQAAAGLAESVVLRLALARWLPPPAAHPAPLRGVLRALLPFCAGVAGSTLMATVLMQADKLLLAQRVPLAQFGVFMLVVSIANGLCVVVAPLQSVAYPRLSELAARGDEGALRAEYHGFAQLMSVLLLPPAAMLCLFPHDVVLAWTGNAATAEAAAPVLAVYAVGTALWGLLHVPHAAQLATGWSRLAALQNMAAAVLVLPVLWWAIPRYGTQAGAWVWLGLNAGLLAASTWAMHRRLLRGQQAAWLVRDVLAPLAGALAAASVLDLLRQAWPAPSRPLLALFLAGGAAIGVLCAALCCAEGRHWLRLGLARGMGGAAG